MISFGCQSCSGTPWRKGPVSGREDGKMQDENAALIAERLGRAMDALHAELKEVRLGQEHLLALSDQRLGALEKMVADHEERIRRNSEGVTRFSVATGGSGLISLAALIKSFLGGVWP
jgi:hypothetical protein